MLESHYREYVRRFNEEDDTVFDDYLAADMRMKNGTLEYTGIDGMKRHYRDKIWPHYVEHLSVPRFVSDATTASVQMKTMFTARRDTFSTIFGPVLAGETFRFDGIVMYRIDRDERFREILVAYNSFVHTARDGRTRDLGIPH